ncbi:MAG: type II secretion system F family protein [Candidatus Staskawiczbacteria bacterium]|nr:type II secretion system F family protein [Candidatus Staskawiczbacteria bacterium]
MKYVYRARTKAGKMETGTIEAYSREAASLLLQKYNIFVTYLEEQDKESSFLRFLQFESKVSRKELAVFFRQLSLMLQSRVPVVQSLQALSSQTNKASFKKILQEISSLVQEGVPLSEALSAYPKVFNNFCVSLVKSGESTGNISGSLAYISEHLELENDIMGQIRQAMVYPMFVVLVLFVVLGIIVIEVIPRIMDLIKETNSKPEFFTSMMLGFYTFLASYWLHIVAGSFFIVVFLVYYFSTKEGKKNYDALSLGTPFLGGLLKKVYLARFCSNVSTLITAGISINKALKITEDTVSNVVYKGIISEIERGVSGGERMSLVMVKYQAYFPNFIVQMIKVGEETGKLDTTLMEVVRFYQKDIKRSVDLFSSLLEPVMIIFLGIIVAILAISVLSPLYGVLGNI